MVHEDADVFTVAQEDPHADPVLLMRSEAHEETQSAPRRACFRSEHGLRVATLVLSMFAGGVAFAKMARSIPARSSGSGSGGAVGLTITSDAQFVSSLRSKVDGKPPNVLQEVGDQVFAGKPFPTDPALIDLRRYFMSRTPEQQINLVNPFRPPPPPIIQLCNSTKYTLEDLLDERPGLPVYVATTKDKMGQRRVEHLQSQCRELGLYCIIIPPSPLPKVPALNDEALAAYSSMLCSGYEVAMMTEDDTTFIPNLLGELRATIRDIPRSDWKSLHLCSRSLQKRGVGQTDTRFSLHPDYNYTAASLATTPSHRVFLGWPLQKENLAGVYPGGPCTYIVTRAGASELREVFLPKRGTWQPIDVILRDLAVTHPGEHYLAATPQLCSEYWGWSAVGGELCNQYCSGTVNSLWPGQALKDGDSMASCKCS